MCKSASRSSLARKSVDGSRVLSKNNTSLHSSVKVDTDRAVVVGRSTKSFLALPMVLSLQDRDSPRRSQGVSSLSTAVKSSRVMQQKEFMTVGRLLTVITMSRVTSRAGVATPTDVKRRGPRPSDWLSAPLASKRGAPVARGWGRGAGRDVQQITFGKLNHFRAARKMTAIHRDEPRRAIKRSQIFIPRIRALIRWKCTIRLRKSK